jgi:hypothetical protein
LRKSSEFRLTRDSGLPEAEKSAADWNDEKSPAKPGSLERQDFGPPGTGAFMPVETDLEPKPAF